MMHFMYTFVTLGALIYVMYKNNKLIKKNELLHNVNNGTMMILRAYIRNSGGKLEIPSESFLSPSLEDEEIYHATDCFKKTEVFTLKRGK